VLLAFRVPREQSTPRIAIWRRLKALGVAHLQDGLVALPLNSRNREQLEWIASEVADAGGAATVWIGRVALATAERELVRRMQTQVDAEYELLIAEVHVARSQEPGRRRRSLGRLRRHFRRVRQRDHFPTQQQDTARQAIDDLAASLEEAIV